MKKVSTYKDLLIWQKGIQIVKEIYSVMNDFLKDEMYGLQSQIRRSSISIPSNIAERWGRNYSKSYSQFLKCSRGSLLELETQIIIAHELNYISIERFNKIQGLITEESKMLNAFIKSIDK
jgi:four helix bundle protein